MMERMPILWRQINLSNGLIYRERPKLKMSLPKENGEMFQYQKTVKNWQPSELWQLPPP